MNQNVNYGGNTIEQYQMQVPNDVGSTDLSLENNFSNYEGQLSSVPANMSNHAKTHRANSISRIPERSSYFKDTFLFEKMGGSKPNDDSTIRKDSNPIQIEQLDVKSFQPRILQLNKPDPDALSNSSYSSQSSLRSFTDGGSCSSLELSFDGAGTPYLKPGRPSAFAKIKNNSNNDNSHDEENKEEEPEKHMDLEEGSYDKKQKVKSSFFRLKDANEEDT
jgi:hypothetical protein